MSEVLPLSEARSRLSPLIKAMRPTAAPLAISVHGSVKAYLVTPEQLDHLLARVRRDLREDKARPTIRGSIQLLRSLEEGSAEASRTLSESAMPPDDELARG
ncbi:MAG: type II toxin-antitoxin system Phd/YefM family antitoxin [Myxococcaceae bacterium]|nr:type II toxin-antitoxin system Phd/YefM family antitoxin [Myxococcaceae bacterium]MCI0672330.1 type II toxin-antitoxin system Phd/YefM family antitoxin [Myxococcaceae bacterium]